MCELLAMSSNTPLRLTVSLAALAARAKIPSKNQDGWGLACYQGKDVALFRNTTSADADPLIPWLVEHGPVSTIALGYIRHSTQGQISLANTGPFTRELYGRSHSFTHNGNLRCSAPFRAASGRRFTPIGETDSEWAFCELLENLAQLAAPSGQLPSLQDRLAVIAKMARQFRQCGPGNFIYSDGDVLFVHADQRWQQSSGNIAPPALHMLNCSCQQLGDALLAAERLDSELPAHTQNVVLLSTVPLSTTALVAEQWQPLPRGQLLALRAGDIVASVIL